MRIAFALVILFTVCFIAVLVLDGQEPENLRVPLKLVKVEAEL